MCKNCRPSYPPQRYPAIGKRCMGCGKLNHFRAVCRSMRHKEVHKVEQETDEYTEEDRQIDMVNIDFINSDVKSPGIIAQVETSSYQISANISYKIDMGSNGIILPFCKHKILFPR